MIELWKNVTVGQGLLVLVATWLLLRAADLIADVVRRRFGLPPRPGDHCEHCDDIEHLGERLDRLCDLSHDQANDLERIREAAEKTADTAEQLADRDTVGA